MAPAVAFHLQPRPAFRPPGTIPRTPPSSPIQVICPVSIPDGSGFRPGQSGPTVVLFRLRLSLSGYAPDPEPADCPTGTTASEWGVDPAGTSPAVRPPTASCFRLPGTIPHIGCVCRHPRGWRCPACPRPSGGLAQAYCPVRSNAARSPREEVFIHRSSILENGS
jgi:hypothetical protein